MSFSLNFGFFGIHKFIGQNVFMWTVSDYFHETATTPFRCLLGHFWKKQNGNSIKKTSKTKWPSTFTFHIMVSRRNMHDISAPKINWLLIFNSSISVKVLHTSVFQIKREKKNGSITNYLFPIHFNVVTAINNNTYVHCSHDILVYNKNRISVIQGLPKKQNINVFFIYISFY